MGKKAFKLLYKEIRNKKKNKAIIYKDVVLDTALVIRNSTRKKRI
jgi:LacI family transcriptional regulator